MKKQRIDENRLSRIKKDLRIAEYSGKVGTMSLGMKEKVALATALFCSPELILIDEAFSNLHDKQDFVRTYKEFCEESKIDVIYSIQNPDDSSTYDRLYKIDEGKLTIV